ncbi:MAG TPA: NAD(P)-dependent oxidoreductase [Ilumatobacteraceae bacterium]|nr:NAD(P)-dependent oxidoreductase [Ilumatobacteraceae bacterium]
MNPTTPRVLVTGAAGRLGGTVAELFHAEGFDLLATDVVDAHDVPYRFERADLLDHESVAELLPGIDVVLHIGNHPGIGRRPPQLVFNENIAMNENVFQGAAEHGVSRIVFASTVQLIGSHADERTVVDPPPRPRFPISGDTPPTPSNAYALSKTVSEVMLRYYAERCGIQCTALRLPLLHHHQDSIMVDSGSEHPDDIVEGFTGLTYDDAASLFRAVVASDLTGFRIFMAGTSHRHRELDLPDLIRTYYPEVDPDTPDLIDLTAVTRDTGWQPGPGYRRPSADSTPPDPTPPDPTPPGG